MLMTTSEPRDTALSCDGDWERPDSSEGPGLSLAAAILVLGEPAGRGAPPANLTEVGGYRLVEVGTANEAIQVLGHLSGGVTMALVNAERSERGVGRLMGDLRTRHPEILPVIVVDRDDREQIRRAYAEGAEMVMQRPTTKDELTAALSAMKHQAEERRRLVRARAHEKARPMVSRLAGAVRSLFSPRPGTRLHSVLQSATVLTFAVIFSLGAASALDAAAGVIGQNVRRACAFMDNVEGYLDRDEARELGSRGAGR